MPIEPDAPTIFHTVGLAVGASQIFETVFVLGSRLALMQASVEVLEDIEPVSQSRAFKQPIKALLNELAQAQTIQPGLEARVSQLIDDRNRVVHRLFRETGWPAPLPPDKENDIRQLCARVASECTELSLMFLDLLLVWMKRFPATSPTAIAHERSFKELAERVRRESRSFGTT